MITVFYLLNYVIKMFLFCVKSRTAMKSSYNSEVLYKSNHFFIINKEPDLKINSNNPKERSLQIFLRENFPQFTNHSLTHEFYFPHRLDFATSGVICIPIHKKACQTVSDAFLKRETKKYYIALVRGLMSKECLDISFPIGEDVRENLIQKMCTTESLFCIKPRLATTKLVVLSEGLYDNYPSTKVLIRPITGRRHQIRVHASQIGHTIVGDYTYSNRKDQHPPRMYLHSIRLVLPNAFEDLDVSTCDPFDGIKLWKQVHILNSLHSAYLKLDDSCQE